MRRTRSRRTASAAAAACSTANGGVAILVGVAEAPPRRVVGRQVVDQQQLAGVGRERRQAAQLKRRLVLAAGRGQAQRARRRRAAVHLHQPRRDRDHARDRRRARGRWRERLAFGARVGIEEQQDVAASRRRRPGSRPDRNPGSPRSRAPSHPARPRGPPLRATAAAVVHDDERHGDSARRDARPRGRAATRPRRARSSASFQETRMAVISRTLTGGRAIARRRPARAASAAPGRAAAARRAAAAASPVQADRAHVRQIRAQEGRAALREQRRRRSCGRASATGCAASRTRGETACGARARALVPGAGARVAARTASPCASQPQRQVHVLVVREVRALERRAGRGARGPSASRPVERRRRRDARDLEGLARAPRTRPRPRGPAPPPRGRSTRGPPCRSAAPSSVRTRPWRRPAGRRTRAARPAARRSPAPRRRRC